jgi:hypothetical protein
VELIKFLSVVFRKCEEHLQGYGADGNSSRLEQIREVYQRILDSLDQAVSPSNEGAVNMGDGKLNTTWRATAQWLSFGEVKNESLPNNNRGRYWGIPDTRAGTIT